MNDDELSPLPPELSSLFDAERRREGPSSSAKDRVHQALLVSIAAGAGLGAGAASATAASASAAAGKAAAGAVAGSGAALASGGAASAGAAAATTTAAAATTTAAGGALAKGLAFALVTAMAGTAGTGVYLAQRDDKPAVVADHRPVTDVPAAFDPSVLGGKPEEPAAPVAPAPEPDPIPVAAPVREPVVEVIRAKTPEPTPEERGARLQGERAVLDEARSAITRNDPGAALIALEAHRAGYADGALVEERQALTVLALVKAGRADEARQKAEAFRAAYPGSLLLPAVDAAVR